MKIHCRFDDLLDEVLDQPIEYKERRGGEGKKEPNSRSINLNKF